MICSTRMLMRFLTTVALLVVCATLGGCNIEIYNKIPVRVSVRDAETDVPIANAQVAVKYLCFMTLIVPKPVTTTTDRMGGIVKCRG